MLSKRKLLYLIPITVFCLVTGASLLLAKTGHFKLLADVLHISADTVVTSYPAYLYVSGAGTPGVDGVYAACGTLNDKPRYHHIVDGKIMTTGVYYDISWGPVYYASNGSHDAQAYWHINKTAQTSGINIYTDHSVAYYYQPRSGAGISPVSNAYQRWDQGIVPFPTVTSLGGNAADNNCTAPSFFEVDGVVKEQGTNVLIAGASVNIASKTATTDANGGFKIQGIPLVSVNPESPSSYPLSVSKTGYNNLLASLASYMLGSGIAADQIYGIGIIYLTKNTSPPAIDQTKFNLRGQILVPNWQGVLGATTYKPLNGVQVKVSCIGADCSVKPWTATSLPTLTTSPAGAKYNYEVKDIDAGQTLTATTGLKMEFTKDGYTFAKYVLADGIWRDYNPAAKVPAPLILKGDHSQMQVYIYTDEKENLSLAYQDIRMTDTNTTIGLSGSVVTKEEPNTPLKAYISLTPKNSKDPIASVYTDDKGHYDFGVLNDLVVKGTDYQLKATPISTSDKNYRSSSIMSLRFSEGSKVKIDFKLALNPNRALRFTGYLHKIDTQGNLGDPIVGATVQLVRDKVSGTFLGLQNAKGTVVDSAITDANGFYHITVSNFYDSDKIITDNTNLFLIAFNGQAVSATQSKEEKYVVRPYEGELFYKDFNFGPVDTDTSKFSPVARKKVEININGQVKNDPLNTAVVSSSPMAGISVTLTSLRESSDKNGGSSNMVVSTQTETTDSSGSVTFTGFPKEEAIITLGKVPLGYAEVDSNQLTILANQTSQNIQEIKYNFDFDKLKNSLNLFSQQGADPWAGDHFAYYGTTDSTLASGGCCLTSLANAIQYYLPGFKVTPGMIAALTVKKENGRLVQVLDGAMKAGNFQAIFNAFYHKYYDQYYRQIGTVMPALTVNNVDQSNMAKYNGIPLIYHAGGIPKFNSSGDQSGVHGQHCVDIIGTGKSITYYDVGSLDGQKVDEISHSAMPDPNSPIIAVTSNASQVAIDSKKGSFIWDIKQAIAATIINPIINITDTQNLIISATAKSSTIIPLDKVYLARTVAGVKDYFLMKNTSGDNFSVTIPRNKLTANFSYQIVGINALAAQYASAPTQVKVAISPASLSKSINNLWLNFAYSLNNYLSNHVGSYNYVVQQIISSYKADYAKILALFHLGKASLGSVSGTVNQVCVYGSWCTGNPETNAYVEINGKIAQLDDNGNYTISDIPVGTYTVVVHGLTSGRNYNIPIISDGRVAVQKVTVQSGKKVNLNIVVNDFDFSSSY